MDAVFRRYMDILYQYVLEKSPPTRKPLFLPSDCPAEAIFTRSNTDANGDRENDERPAKRQKYDPTVTNLGDNAHIPKSKAVEPQIGHPPKKERRENKQQAKTTSPNLVAMQAHLFHLLRPLVSQHHNVRDALARSRAGDIPAFENVLTLTEQAIKEGLLDYEADPAKYDTSYTLNSDKDEGEEQEVKEESSVATVKACKRPWWVCQPYVRPLPKEALEKGSLTLGKKDRRRMEIEAVEAKRQGGIIATNGAADDDQEGAVVPKDEKPKEGMVCG